MLSEDMKSLILEEQVRQGDKLMPSTYVETYLRKLDEKAEIISLCCAGDCKGFVAYYCNDTVTQMAYVSLVLVAPMERRKGIGRTLMTIVLEIAKRRGFESCRLEVGKGNEAAYELYVSMGFEVLMDRGDRYLMEIRLNKHVSVSFLGQEWKQIAGSKLDREKVAMESCKFSTSCQRFEEGAF
jgi:ribosomal protein S18 acetylase RimI-like enzyme